MTSPTDKYSRAMKLARDLYEGAGCGGDCGNADHRIPTGDELLLAEAALGYLTPPSASRDTDTPRCNGLESQPVQLIDAWRSLARQLERELAEARAEALRWENLYGDEVSRSAEMAQQLRAEAPLSHVAPSVPVPESDLAEWRKQDAAISSIAFTKEDAAKLVERKARALTEEYCHGDGGPDGYTWTNKEAEWQVILLEELAEEFRNGA